MPRSRETDGGNDSEGGIEKVERDYDIWEVREGHTHIESHRYIWTMNMWMLVELGGFE